MSRRFEVLERPFAGGALIHHTDTVRGLSDTALWTRVRLRKRTTCAATGMQLEPGAEAYRPVGNQLYRMLRLSPGEVEASDG